MKMLKKKAVTPQTAIASKSEVVVEEKPKYTDLRQVMDYTRPLHIFYSGVEYESYLDILYDLGVRNFLMSYEYLKGKGASQLKKYPDMHLFIDSGAFTYMSDPKFENFTIEQWEAQIHTYLNWAERHKDQIFAIADLDLQYLVGNEKVYEWRKKYFEPFMLRTGIPVCFMYHDEGIEQWEYMCKRYPYVGMSLRVDSNFDDNIFKDMFRIAEKHNALIQGMASTKTSLLTQLPFYTVDSTTWNVGLKYGEISVWNKTKMSRVKKDEFETKAFPIIQTYDTYFDFDKIREEDKTEMIRVNAYAFIMAEKYIHERLKAKMYWLKAKTVKVDVDNLPSDFFPSVDWFDGDTTDLADYCKKCNINPEYEGALDVLHDATAFLNWDNPDYSAMRDWYDSDEQSSLIDGLHDSLVNRIVPDKEAKIQDLIAFYKDCVSGNNDKLLQLGTNFDRTIRERESYIEEEDTELVELSPEEIQKRIGNLLPDKSAEEAGDMIQAMDAEIFKKAEIIPTFDENGKFVKGHQLARKRKDVYSNKYPKLACDTCINAAKCPEYKSGYACAYNKMFKRFDTRNMDDLIDAMQGIVSFNMERMQRSMIGEMLNGVIDPVTSQLMDTNLRYINTLKSMYESAGSEMIRQTQVVRSDGSRETTTAVNVNPQNNSIMEKLLSGLMQSSKDTPEEPKQAETENNEIVVDNIDG